MGSPNTIDVCKNCGNPVIQWNNTGAWEHLNSATMDQAQSRAYQNGAKSVNLANATLCGTPRLVVEQNSVAGRTNANYRTATKKS
jgi:hypothetical protein